MDKVPLPDSLGIDLWDSSSTETYLFDPLLCEANVVESSQLLKTLEGANELVIQEFLILIKKEFLEAIEYKNNNLEKKALMKLDKIISKAPKEMPELRSALILRAEILKDNIEISLYDYEMCVYINEMVAQFQAHTFYLSELAILIEMYSSMGYLEKFKITLEKLKVEFAKHTKTTRFSRKNSKNLGIDADECIRKFGDRITNFEKALINFDACEPPEALKFIDCKMTPFHGYKARHDPKISAASVACTLTKDPELPTRVLANRFIPACQIVVHERPMDHEYYSPHIQCQHCFEITSYMYSCLECRFKSYCSLTCMQADYRYHKYECFGYKTTFLTMLNAGILYRMFIKTIMYLQANIFPHIEETEDIHNFFTLAMEKIAEIGPDSQIKQVLTTIPNYNKINCQEMVTMATFAVRITVFIAEKTNILSEFFSTLNFTNKELMMFISALLLRLQYQLKINSVEFNFSIKNPPLEDIEMPIIVEKEKEQLEDKLTSTDGRSDIYQYFTFAGLDANDYARGVIGEFVNEYSRKHLQHYIKNPESYNYGCKISRVIIDEAFVEQTSANRMGSLNYSSSQKSELVLNTAMVLSMQKNVFSLVGDGIHEQTMEGVYPTIKKFRHSCEPNVELILLQSGSVIGKTLRDIEFGEELVISFGPTYKTVSKIERLSFLNQVFIDCECQHCEKEYDFQHTHNAVYCFNDCRELMLSCQCRICEANTLVVKDTYDLINDSMYKIEKTIRENEPEENFIKHHITKVCMHHLMYPQISLQMYDTKMEFLDISVKKNFVYDSFLILKRLVDQAILIFPEKSTVLMLNLLKISKFLIILLNHNMKKNFEFVYENKALVYEMISFSLNLLLDILDILAFQEVINHHVLDALLNYEDMVTHKHKLYIYECSQIRKDINPYILKESPVEPGSLTTAGEPKFKLVKMTEAEIDAKVIEIQRENSAKFYSVTETEIGKKFKNPPWENSQEDLRSVPYFAKYSKYLDSKNLEKYPDGKEDTQGIDVNLFHTDPPGKAEIELAEIFKGFEYDVIITSDQNFLSIMSNEDKVTEPTTTTNQQKMIIDKFPNRKEKRAIAKQEKKARSAATDKQQNDKKNLNKKCEKLQGKKKPHTNVEKKAVITERKENTNDQIIIDETVQVDADILDIVVLKDSPNTASLPESFLDEVHQYFFKKIEEKNASLKDRINDF